MAPAPDEPEHDVRPDLHLVADSGGELLCRIAERDHDAFEILYRRYARAVYGLAPAPAAHARGSRGRDPAGVRGDLALYGNVRSRARQRCALGVHSRAERDRRP